jgi:trigger factor
MQVSVESSEGLERRMTVEVPAERVNEEVEKRLKKIARSARLDGFRPGKAPLSVIRRRYAGQVEQEVFGELLQSSYFEALGQEQLEPAGEPRIERMDKAPEEGIGYTATFEVMPKVVLKEMGELTIKRPVAEITQEDIDKMIDNLRKQRVEWTDVEREAQNDDRVTINFKGSIDGELFEGGSANDVPLVLGSGRMIAGFEQGLIGAKAGESRTLELTFPEDYQSEELAGKPASFEVEVTKVAEPKLPEVDEEFAKLFGASEAGVDGLLKDVRTNLERELERRIQAKVKDQAMKALLEANKLEVPKVLIEQEADELKQKALASLGQGGAQADLQLPRELFLEDAERRVALGLIIGEVVRENKMEIDTGRVRSKIEQFAADYETPEDVVKWYYGNREQLAQVENLVLEEQVMDWVLEQVKVEEEPTTFAALTESGK